MEPRIYFISGVCGVGKTSVAKHLKQILPSDKFDVRDFDERGVPDGGGFDWHDRETLYWLAAAAENAYRGKSTVISGFVEPRRFAKVYKEKEHPPAELLLLHASAHTIRKRLMGRYTTPESIQDLNRASGFSLEAFVENNASYVATLHSIFQKAGAPTIQTDSKTPQEIAQEIARDFFGSSSGSSSGSACAG